MSWNKCQYCGQFISFDDFQEGKAVNLMVMPASDISWEEWETYHTKCNDQYTQDLTGKFND